MNDDDKIEEIKKILNDCLNSINEKLVIFFKYYKKKYNNNDKINSIICTNKIFKNRNKLILLSNIIKSTENFKKYELFEHKKKIEMYKMKLEEMNKVKDFIDKNKEILLLEGKNKSSMPLLSSDKYNIEENIDNKNIEDNDNIIMKHKNELPEKKIEKNNDTKNMCFKKCYCCKDYLFDNNIHFFYSNLCKRCGELNYSYRFIKMELTGRIAIVTGGRIKIGFEIAKQLLNFGCKVIVTSRFPKDSLIKFKSDKNYNNYKNNLFIYPIDFRLIESTIKFVEYISNNFSHIDILINNAAQTIRRSTSYYKYLLQTESQKFSEEDENKIIYINNLNINKKLKLDETKKNELINYEKNSELSLPLSVISSQIKILEEKEQPKEILMGKDGQPYDFTQGKNSWKLELDEISFQEFMEVQIINSWTPFYLISKIKPMMDKSPFNDKYIINVTGNEGIFNTYKKTAHPHTNMAKAALNMLTRTCGEYYKNFGIYMSAVDTGWVNPMGEMNNLFKNKDESKAFEEIFYNIPLDFLDGAMRVLYPIIEGINNKNYLYGILLKDYKEYHW